METARERALESIRDEIRQDTATTLQHLGEQLSDALAAWKVAPNDRALRARASNRLWVMIVQREAIGLTTHDVVYDTYRVPRSLFY